MEWGFWGFGVASEQYGPVEWVEEAPASPPPGPFFGGWGFDPERPWPGLPHERWVLPEVLGWWDGHRPWLAAFGPQGTSARALTERLARVTEVEPVVEGAGARVVESATARSRWDALVGEALGAIGRGGLEKVVVARPLRVEAQRPFSERAVLKALEARGLRSRVFLHREPGGAAFVGATPELLCDVQGRVLETEALAGTASPEHAAELLRDDKELREHRAVVEGILAVVAPYAERVECPPAPGLKTLPHLVHLHTPIRVQLKAGVEALEVARALHPTPAVGGTPRKAALAFLRQHEGFARGWYAGVIGARGPERLTLAVALRCGRLDGRTAELFVGAGLVAGSVAGQEWAETTRKARAMLDALGVDDA